MAFTFLLRQPGLHQHALLQGLRMHVVTRMPGDRDASGLGRMLKLTVAAFGRDQVPNIILYQFDNLTYLHT